MKNKYFPDEEIELNDLYFVCYMIERVARHIHQKNKYVVNKIGKDGLYHLISLANVLHCENPDKVEDDWIKDYDLKDSDFDITKVDKELAEKIPTPLEMGEVYQRLINDTLDSKEDYVDGIIRVYNNEICDTIDNYNCSAFYEPSYVIARAYQSGGFQQEYLDWVRALWSIVDGKNFPSFFNQNVNYSVIPNNSTRDNLSRLSL